MSEAFFRAGYYAKQGDIEKLRAWIEEAISTPSMSRELRQKGAEVSVASRRAEGGYYSTLEDPLPKEVREAVDSICPSTVAEHEYEQDIDESPEHEFSARINIAPDTMLGTRGKGAIDTGSNHVGFRCVQ